MIKKGVLPIVVVATLCIIMFSEIANTSSFIPPVSRTGAPSEGNCSDCHSGNLNTGAGGVTFSLDGLAYVPDSTYNVTVQVDDPLKSRFGFQITALDGKNNGIGSFVATNTANTSPQSNLGRQYINQKNANTNNIWSFDWTAPDSNIGPITFYVCGNATNNNSSATGDNVYTQEYTLDTCGISIVLDSLLGSYSDSSGAIGIVVLNDLEPYTYAWSNGDSIANLDNLPQGDYTVTVTDGSGCIENMTINVPVWISIEGGSSDEAFKVYPNPSNGLLSIQSSMLKKHGQITIFNMKGKRVYQQTHVESGGTKILDLSELGAGIYTVKLDGGSQPLFRKIVIH